MELTIFLASWIASSLHLEDGVAPMILRAYRVENPNRGKTKGPWDIIVEFVDFRTKLALFNTARQEGGLKFNNVLTFHLSCSNSRGCCAPLHRNYKKKT